MVMMMMMMTTEFIIISLLLCQSKLLLTLTPETNLWIDGTSSGGGAGRGELLKKHDPLSASNHTDVNGVGTYLTLLKAM